MPKLTIAIPTYNRSALLNESLDRLTKFDLSNVEIIVSDNASTDSTASIVDSYRCKIKNLYYYKNETNIGFDGNFLNCYEKATGDYIWLLSDDDIILPGAIDSIFNLIDLYSPVCLHLNSCNVKKNNKYSAPRFDENENIIYKIRDDFIKKVGIYVTFISSLIMKTSLVKKIENKNNYFNTNIIQSHILFEIMKNDGLYIINTYNCLAARPNDSVNYDVLKTWVYNYSMLYLKTGAKCCFNLELLKSILLEHLNKEVFRFVVHYRITCKNEKKWDRECLNEIYNVFPNLRIKYNKVLNANIFKLKLWELMFRFKGIMRRIIK